MLSYKKNKHKQKQNNLIMKIKMFILFRKKIAHVFEKNWNELKQVGFLKMFMS